MDLTLPPGATVELAAAVFQTAVTAGLAVLFWAMFSRVRETFLKWWGLTWTLYAVRMGAILAFMTTEWTGWLFWHQVLTGWTAVALLGASLAFGRPTRSLRVLAWVALFPVVWSYVAIYQLDVFLLAAAPAVLFLSIATGLAAITFFSHQRRVRSPASLYLATTLALWSLHHLDYPFLRARGAWAPWGYYLDVLLLGATAFGILILVFEDYRVGLETLSRLAARVVEPATDPNWLGGLLLELCRIPGVEGAALFGGDAASGSVLLAVGTLDRGSGKGPAGLEQEFRRLASGTSGVRRVSLAPDDARPVAAGLTWVPLGSAAGTRGGLAVAGHGRHGFAAVEEQYLLAMGQHIAVALDRAELDRQLHDRTRELERLAALMVGQHEAERRRLSRELHDETAQALAALRMRLALLNEELGDRATPALDEAVAVLEDAIAGIRKVTTRLRPLVLDELGLLPALRALIREYSKSSGTAVEFECAVGSLDLAPEAELTLYRALQEGLSNVARHAAGSDVSIRLSEDRGVVVLDVEDGGAAGGAEANRNGEGNGGAGLTGMRERVGQLDGEVVFTTSEAGGVLTVRIPSGNV